jgi:hypothetical protein
VKKKGFPPFGGLRKLDFYIIDPIFSCGKTGEGKEKHRKCLTID